MHIRENEMLQKERFTLYPKSLFDNAHIVHPVQFDNDDSSGKTQSMFRVE